MIKNRLFRESGFHASFLAAILMALVPFSHLQAQVSRIQPQSERWSPMAPLELQSTGSPQQWRLKANDGAIGDAWIDIIEERSLTSALIERAAEKLSGHVLSLTASVATGTLHQGSDERTVWGLILDSTGMDGRVSRIFHELIPVASLDAAQEMTKTTLEAFQGQRSDGFGVSLPPAKTNGLPFFCQRNCRTDWIQDDRLCVIEFLACDAGVAALGVACQAGCPSSGPGIAACISGCTVAGLLAIIVCTVQGERCQVEAERNYQDCFDRQELDCREDPDPGHPPGP